MPFFCEIDCWDKKFKNLSENIGLWYQSKINELFLKFFKLSIIKSNINELFFKLYNCVQTIELSPTFKVSCNFG